MYIFVGHLKDGVMLKRFIIECLLFQTKDDFSVDTGLFVWACIALCIYALHIAIP